MPWEREVQSAVLARGCKFYLAKLWYDFVPLNWNRPSLHWCYKADVHCHGSLYPAVEPGHHPDLVNLNPAVFSIDTRLHSPHCTETMLARYEGADENHKTRRTTQPPAHFRAQHSQDDWVMEHSRSTEKHYTQIIRKLNISVLLRI